LFKEYERVSYVAVSVKQIWYDVRMRKDFAETIKEWTCNVKELWRDMVVEVIGDYYTLTLNEVRLALNLPKNLLEGGSFELSDNVHCDVASHVNAIGSDIANRPKENGDSSNMLDADQNMLDGEVEKESLLHEESESQKEISRYRGDIIDSDKNRRRRRSTSIIWKPLILSEVEFCPEVINEYAVGCRSKTVREHLKTKVRKHLAYLGWTIEWTENNCPQNRRYRYKSPDIRDQKFYTSIFKVTKVLQEDSNMNSVPPQICGNLSHLLCDPPQMGRDLDVCPPTKDSSTINIQAEPELCPLAIVKYYFHSLERNSADKIKWKLKAKKHLLAEGWIFDYPTERRKTTLYKSPQNQCLGTLQGACRLYLKEKIPEWTNSDQVNGDDLLPSVFQLLQKEPELHTIDGTPPTSKRNHKRTRTSKASTQKDLENEVPTRVLRSSKRVQKALGLSHQKPQNVLSWLVDYNIVLPKFKVFYREIEGEGNSPTAEGRITREGIKCNCCQNIYGLSGFANHAGGSSNCRPSTCIFLKDGRSLLDCMREVMQDHKAREVMEEPCNYLFEGENDNICSVCNYGGELILCDQCPSAFHKNCLNLEVHY
jgi:hypothetical protein